jgi:hypothetical protein
MRVSRRFAAGLFTALIAFGPGQAARTQDVVVFAAASLTNALDEAAKLFERQGGAHSKISYAASSALAKQIESGAPADMFISADLDWMNYLEQRQGGNPCQMRLGREQSKPRLCRPPAPLAATPSRSPHVSQDEKGGCSATCSG